MAYVNIWIHAVWGTKNHDKILSKELRKELFSHIKENGRDKGIYIDFINGYVDHVHCLIGLNADMCIAKAMQLIKGESAFWANKVKLIKPKLLWADEYYAASVSESHKNIVRDYIKVQEEHHKKIHIYARVRRVRENF
jgi:putative transposase